MTEEAPSTTSSDLSVGQSKVLAALRICSASLSILGSGALIFKILRDRVKNVSTTPYDRMILGLSASDILWSATYAISLFLYPSGWYEWAFGNAATCQTLGFLYWLSASSLWYNGMLSYYFLLMVLSQVHQKNYVRQFELWLHLTAIYWPIIAIMGLFLSWFGEESRLCFIPNNMSIVLIFVGIPSSFMILSMVVNYGAIYAIVRKSLRSVQNDRIQKESTTQIILYAVCLVISITPTSLRGILEGLDYSDNDIYPLLVLQSSSLPLQGFFNFFIYIKPIFARFRAAHPNKSKWFALKQSILKSKAPPLQHRRVANNITHTSDVVITDITLLSNQEMNPSEAFFYPGQLFSTEFNNPQLDDPSEQPETSNNVNEEGQG